MNILNIEQWELLQIEDSLNFTYNYSTEHRRLEIDTSKFYYYLKNNYGLCNVNFKSVAHFFVKSNVTTDMEWCYIFKVESDFIFITGSDKIYVRIFTMEYRPEEYDLLIFANNINNLIETYSLNSHSNERYSIYFNYCYFLKNEINSIVSTIENFNSPPPDLTHLDRQSDNKPSEESKSEFLFFAHEYNSWLKEAFNCSSSSIKLQILLPIYFESIIDLTFRIKLKKSLFNEKVKYPDQNSQLNIFQYFERMNFSEKIELIGKNCFSINETSLKNILEETRYYINRNDRNLHLHGNATIYKNKDFEFYIDENNVIGLPDYSILNHNIGLTIFSVSQKKNVLTLFNDYTRMTNSFIEAFEDDGYLKSILDSIVFGHNNKTGGSVLLPRCNYLSELEIPTDLTELS